MKFKEFQKKNHSHSVRCRCCAFCAWFEGYPYDFGGRCTHQDITGDNERYCATVNDFEICDKFSEER